MKRNGIYYLVLLLVLAGLNGTIDLNALFNYEDQDFPLYVTRDNTPPFNPINDATATLGRVLFYDVSLSANDLVSCASCHQQEFAFGDTARLSIGLDGGLTGRHSMRLVNARFADENRFFWDERANSLENQTTRPIQDHIEMGFSGADGDPDLDSLFRKLAQLPYYEDLFTFAYGTPEIDELKVQRALAQFIRSIQSFDAKYDVGRAQVNNDNAPFPNFTPQENAGKSLFLRAANVDGAGCAACHRPPTFDIAPNSGNNGIIGVAGNPGAVDLTNTRSPSLRDLVNSDGALNGPFMHDGSLPNLLAVINHYDDIDFDPTINPELDPRLRGGPGNPGQDLDLTPAEKNALVAFLSTLSGNEIYTAERWSDPFGPDGELTIIPVCGTPDPVIIEATICSGDDYEGYAETGIYTDTYTAANGCDSLRELRLIVLPDDHPDCMVSSADEAVTLAQVVAYPNPFRTTLTIDFSEVDPTTIVLYDLGGRPVHNVNLGFGERMVRLPAADLPMGIYLVVGYGADGQRLFTAKVMKE